MVRIQIVYRGRKGQEAGSSNTRPEGTTTSRNAPVAWSRASSTDVIPTSRLSRFMLSTAASRVKSDNAGSCGSTHWSRGSPHAGKWLPPDVKARDDPLSVHSATAAMLGDPSAASPLHPAHVGRRHLYHRGHRSRCCLGHCHSGTRLCLACHSRHRLRLHRQGLDR